MSSGSEEAASAAPPDSLAAHRALGELQIDKEGRGVAVAVVDSGVDVSHPWFAGCDVEAFAIEQKGPQFTIDRTTAGDASGHGTACAGIILRLVPKAKLVSVRALGADGRGSRDALVTALRFCVREGYAVVNLSLGIDVPKAAPLKPTDYRSVLDLYEIADEAFTKRVMFVAAGPNVASLRTYPGRAKSLIGVGRGSFADPERVETNLTADYEILAPGNDVVAPALGGGERKWTGTSFACPHIAGHVARIIAGKPSRTPSEVRWVLHQLASITSAAQAPPSTARSPTEVPTT
ncbi:MAG: S8 family serine peptidase [Polyangiaceae bacterium]